MILLMKLPPNASRYFILGGINPLYAMAYKKTAGTAGMMTYIYCKWKMGIPNYLTKLKSAWVKMDNISLNADGFTMDRKTKTKALRKLAKEKLIQLELEKDSGKAPLVRLMLL